MARGRKAGRPPKKAKAAKAKARKPVDQEVKGGKKAKEDAPDKGPLSGAGHNLTQVKKLVVPFAERYNRLLDKKAEEAASYMADVRVLIEDAANELGCKKGIIREALQRNRRIHKDAEKDEERDRAELDQRDTIEEALGHFSDSPLGAAAIARETAEKRGPGRPKKATNGSGTVVQMPLAEAPEEDDEGDESGGEDVPAAA